ncbi:C40 family peptidase [Leeuwenhoekiella parthenopeia]|uniref:C40 family peptidase n=1 Tax=Leeuwenhoekiella parthenopeia TaxID=2890320 RepID=A0ABS8GUQ4_9FLAO|nr:C40 family peptidase [Leeuwenhoekiella parthenopeia]MCC4213521.1 C40 family peptidase [Leeuwenhoekiella parthenopeia]
MKRNRILKQSGILALSLALASCGGSKRSIQTPAVIGSAAYEEPERREIKAAEDAGDELIYLSEIKDEDENQLRYNIISNARRFEGTPYKYGGTTSKGMDCSGLIYTVFLEENISIPRVSRAIAEEGKRIKTDEVIPGDLLFFITGRRSKNINHVGLVVDVLPGQILFIHSSTSQGVIVSSLNEGYWNNAFVEARRIM